MDRHLRVMKDGYLFAEMVFDYEQQTTGKASITLYQAVAIDGSDLKSIIPLRRTESTFQHAELNTMEEVIAYDVSILKEQGEPMEGELEFTYLAHDYRYVIGNMAGIADIAVNYEENKKELRYISGRRKSEDITAATHALESNIVFISRTLNTHYVDELFDFTQVVLN